MGTPAADKHAQLASIFAHQRPNRLLQNLKQSISSGNSFLDFRARLVVCVAAAAILLCLPTLVVDLLNGNIALVMVTGLGGAAMVAAAGAVLLYQRVELAVNIVLLTLSTMMVGLLFIRQGETLGFYVGVPAIIFLASILASKTLAVFYWLACTALFAVAAYLSHTQWVTIIDMTDPVVASGGIRIGLIILFFNLLTVIVFRDSLRDLLLDHNAKQDEVSRLNNTLMQTIDEKHAWTRVLGHIHDTGFAIAWFYDAKAGQLKHTDVAASGSGAAEPAVLEDSHLEKMNPQSWQAKIYQAIVAAGNGTERWAREISCVDSLTGDLRWYAVTAETHFLDTGTQVVGTLLDITDEKRRSR
ncbi:MAG: hypothetical protein KJP25_12740 [Gammaproteobacteria bacterium]|nr:hypothetical protein [Gammaproteobacteria bacterium]MBT8149765.1 hypothetical protein [Gammaproteobacteria bacterium]NND39005.1 hypothetical protein [Pseudomonadales bacterium]NNM11993.1 hypothetical protein [Pseudomonadales bacterium]RZV57612.1 MAG: hypothetical protein EX270_03560 [Pseudomonadales bacterium]